MNPEGMQSYSTRGTEFDVFMCALAHINRSRTAKIPSRKRFEMGFSQVTVHALRGGVE